MHFGTIDNCTSGEAQRAVDTIGGPPFLLKSEAIFPIDSTALIPSCAGPSTKGDVVVYVKGTNYFFWGCVGLVGLLLLILLISAVK